MTSTVTDFAMVETLPDGHIFLATLMLLLEEKSCRLSPNGLLRDANAILKTLARNVQLLGSTSNQMVVRINALPTSNKLARLQKSR